VFKFAESILVAGGMVYLARRGVQYMRARANQQTNAEDTSNKSEPKAES